MPDPRLISKPDIARLFDVSLRTVDRWARAKGFPPAEGKKGGGSTFDEKAVIAWRLDELEQKHAATVSSLEDEKRRLTAAQATKTELQAKRLGGDVLETGAVRAVWAEVFALLQAEVMTVPNRVRQRLPDVPIAVHEQMETDMRGLLQDMHNRVVSVLGLEAT